MPADSASPPVEDSPKLTALTGIGPAIARKLERLGLRTVRDLLFLLPIRYEDRTRIRPIIEVKPGQRVQIEGVIAHARVIMGRRRSLLCALRRRDRGKSRCASFHFTRQQQSGLRAGTRLLCYGDVRQGPRGFEIVHPSIEGCKNPIPRPSGIGSRPSIPPPRASPRPGLRNLTDHALENALDDVPDLIPARFLAGIGFPELHDALRTCIVRRRTWRWKCCCPDNIPPASAWRSRKYWPGIWA